jgi:hypothetical protein
MEDQDMRELARSVAELQELQQEYPDCVTTRQLLALVEEVQALVACRSEFVSIPVPGDAHRSIST